MVELCTRYLCRGKICFLVFPHQLHGDNHLLCRLITEPSDHVPSPQATDPDAGANGQVRYRIVNHPDLFVISENGSIYTRVPLDRELRSQYNLVVEASDGAVDPRRTSLVLSIQVIDIDDNSPMFSQETYVVNVPENSLVGTVILKLSVSIPLQVSLSLTPLHVTCHCEKGGSNLSQLKLNWKYIHWFVALVKAIELTVNKGLLKCALYWIRNCACYCPLAVNRAPLNRPWKILDPPLPCILCTVPETTVISKGFKLFLTSSAWNVVFEMSAASKWKHLHREKHTPP